MPALPQIKKGAQWMTAAEIPQTSIFFMSEPVKYLTQQWYKHGLGNVSLHYFTHFDGVDAKMHFIREEFDQQAQWLTEKMIRRPRWTLGVIDRIEKYSRRFMKDADSLRRADHRQMTDRQIVALLERTLRYHTLTNGVGASVSWIADADKERVTKALWRILEEHMQDIGSRHNVVDAFSILTTPRSESYVAQEEKDFLHIGSELYRKKAARKKISPVSSEKAVSYLQHNHPALWKKIQRHHQKYCWLAYQYRGPATPLTEYIQRWQALMQEKQSPRQLLRTLDKDRREILQQQKQLEKVLHFNQRLKDLFQMGRRLVFIKGFRKEAIYHGMYCYEPLLREVGRQLGLSLGQVWAMKTEEIEPALLRGHYDADEFNARQKKAVVYADRRRHVVFTGRQYQQFMKKIEFEKSNTKKTRELSGTPACPGVVQGIVKVINTPQEMSKMNPGDIMVAHNTNPNVVPAMKKAAALVSESGGLTCHTAIVARELRTPCIVGVPGADKVLKDGDRVEVNADNGVVRKLG